MAPRQGTHATVELAGLPSSALVAGLTYPSLFREESVMMAWDQAILVTMFLQGLKAITGPDQVVGRDSAESPASHCLACLPALAWLQPLISPLLPSFRASTQILSI